MALSGSALRAVAHPIMRLMAHRGITNIARAQRLIRSELGAAPRTQDFYNTYQKFLREAKRASFLKFVPNEKSISKRRHVPDEWLGYGNVRYRVEFKGYDTETGDEVTFYRHISFGTRHTAGFIKDRSREAFEKTAGFEHYQQQGAETFQIEQVNVVGAFVKKGYQW